MRIASLTLWQVPLTSHETYYMAAGKTCATVTTTVLRLRTDCGAEGWGEACPIPGYLPAFAGGLPAAVEELAPVLLGADPIGPEAVISRCDAVLPSHAAAKSLIDIALWDLTGKAAGQPLWALLGGRRQATLPVYHSITCIDPHEMARIALEVQAAGITQFQVKLGADDDWQADVARLRLVREAVGPGPLVYGDWNRGSTTLTATRVGRAVRDLDLMLEQPCATLVECAEVKRATGLPMKIDEEAHDIASLLEAHRLGCIDAVALKLSKFGGLSALRRARDLCLSLGIQVMVEDTWGSDIAMAAALHLGAATPPSALVNVCDLAGYVSPRLDASGPARANGRIAPPSGPGLGIAPDPARFGSPIAEYSQELVPC